MRTKVYEVPATHTIEQAAAHMIGMIGYDLDSISPGEDDDVHVVAQFNSIELVAWPGATAAEIISRWDLKHHERQLQRERIYPVQVATRYLLETLSEEDRQVVLKELVPNLLPKVGC
jgi:hypothetical protein